MFYVNSYFGHFNVTVFGAHCKKFISARRLFGLVESVMHQIGRHTVEETLVVDHAFIQQLLNSTNLQRISSDLTEILSFGLTLFAMGVWNPVLSISGIAHS